MTGDDLGAFFSRESDGSIWRFISRSASTATLEQVHPDVTDRLRDLIRDADAVAEALPSPETYSGAALRAGAALYRLRAVALDAVRPARIVGVVGAPIFEGFELLVPASERRGAGKIEAMQAEFWRGRPTAPDGVPSFAVTTHESAAVCPLCATETVELATTFYIQHPATCTAVEALRVLHGEERPGERT